MVALRVPGAGELTPLPGTWRFGEILGTMIWHKHDYMSWGDHFLPSQTRKWRPREIQLEQAGLTWGPLRTQDPQAV